MTAAPERIDEALWLAEGETVSFYGFAYPTRSVIVRLAENRLWVWSPIRLRDELRSDIERLGPVAHLVPPNKLRHLHLAQWKSAYPAGQSFGDRSRRSRAVASSNSLARSAEPHRPNGATTSTRPGFADRLRWTRLTSFHRPSRTAIVADLIQAFDNAFLARNWPWWARPLPAWTGSLQPIVVRPANGGCHFSTARPRDPRLQEC
jgi:hypothetical protein